MSDISRLPSLIRVEMESKKLINSTDKCVDEMLHGVACALPGLVLHKKNRVILVRDWKPEDGKVGVLSGGGSGHEPFAAGYVGRGMLTATCAGSVFASPPAISILHAIQCITKGNPEGTLVIIPNYTGDCLNFGLAVERAKTEGLKVESVIVGEDCALLSRGLSVAGRRGMCGLLYAFKIAGTMSEKGAPLQEIAKTIRQVVNNMSTIGVALTACSLPGSGPLFTLGSNEMELGLGVHGEAGTERMPICSASEIVAIMLKHVIKSLNLESENDVAVLINNLGGSSHLEQWLILGEVKQQLDAKGIRVHRMYAGPLMTSLDMAGVQVSILKLIHQQKDKWLGFLDADTQACAWPGCVLSRPVAGRDMKEEEEEDYGMGCQLQIQGPSLSEELAEGLKQCLIAGCTAIMENETRLNELDSGCGDGDCGTTLRQFAEGIICKLNHLSLTNPAVLFRELADIASLKMGGTSGALYSLFLTMASSTLSHMETAPDASAWALVLRSGLDVIMVYSQAQQGDRTMLDALIPACEEYEEHVKKSREEILIAVQAAAKAANEGCKKTANMLARAGRASYVSKSLLRNIDAGAFAVTVWLNAINDELHNITF